MASQVEGIKWIPRTNFLVDGFRFQSPRCQAYFLTHFHSDHTTGLSRYFCNGTIYCSSVTAALLTRDMGVAPQFVTALAMDVEVQVAGVPVVLLDANHCPGAVMMLFKVPPADGNGPLEAILHTGDCRWQPWMVERLTPHLHDCGGRVGTLLLDTTYCLPKHVHPPQQDAINSLVAVMREELRREPDTLFMMAAYHIGKERAFLGAARQLGVKVFCNAAKRRVLSLLELPAEDLALLADSEADAAIHVTGWGLRPEALQGLLEQSDGRWKAVMGIRATGWTMRKAPGLHVWRSAGGTVAQVGVPYSEHSSWSELRDCVRSLRPVRLVPTVNASDATHSRAVVDRFADLMDVTKDRSRLDWYFGRLKRMFVGSNSDTQQPAAGSGCDAAAGSTAWLGSKAPTPAHGRDLEPLQATTTVPSLCGAKRSLSAANADDEAQGGAAWLGGSVSTHPHGRNSEMMQANLAVSGRRRTKRSLFATNNDDEEPDGASSPLEGEGRQSLEDALDVDTLRGDPASPDLEQQQQQQQMIMPDDSLLALEGGCLHGPPDGPGSPFAEECQQSLSGGPCLPSVSENQHDLGDRPAVPGQSVFPSSSLAGEQAKGRKDCSVAVFRQVQAVCSQLAASDDVGGCCIDLTRDAGAPEVAVREDGSCWAHDVEIEMLVGCTDEAVTCSMSSMGGNHAACDVAAAEGMVHRSDLRIVTCASGDADAGGVSHGTDLQNVSCAGGAQDVDLASVDVEEQQRLWRWLSGRSARTGPPAGADSAGGTTASAAQQQPQQAHAPQMLATRSAALGVKRRQGSASKAEDTNRAGKGGGDLQVPAGAVKGQWGIMRFLQRAP